MAVVLIFIKKILDFVLSESNDNFIFSAIIIAIVYYGFIKKK